LVRFPNTPTKPSRLLLGVLSTADIAFKCFRVAAPLALRQGVCRASHAGEDHLSALLAVRVLDWAFRRVEVDRPEVILHITWRMRSCRLLWDFLASDGREDVEDPDDAARQFAVGFVVPLLHSSGSNPTAKEGGPDDDEEEEEEEQKERCNHQSEELKPEEASPGTAQAEEAGEALCSSNKDAQRRRRARRRQRGAATQQADQEEDDSSLQAGLDEESEAARREWSRLSLRMMLEMGWRAETGEVVSRLSS